MDGHNQPCHYCKELCDCLAGNPGRWAIPLTHKEEPGVVKWHHIDCVSNRLDMIPVLASLLKLAWEGDLHPEILKKLGEALEALEKLGINTGRSIEQGA